MAKEWMAWTYDKYGNKICHTAEGRVPCPGEVTDAGSDAALKQPSANRILQQALAQAPGAESWQKQLLKSITPGLSEFAKDYPWTISYNNVKLQGGKAVQATEAGRQQAIIDACRLGLIQCDWLEEEEEEEELEAFVPKAKEFNIKTAAIVTGAALAGVWLITVFFGKEKD